MAQGTTGSAQAVAEGVEEEEGELEAAGSCREGGSPGRAPGRGQAAPHTSHTSHTSPDAVPSPFAAAALQRPGTAGGTPWVSSSDSYLPSVPGQLGPGEPHGHHPNSFSHASHHHHQDVVQGLGMAFGSSHTTHTTQAPPVGTLSAGDPGDKPLAAAAAVAAASAGGAGEDGAAPEGAGGTPQRPRARGSVRFDSMDEAALQRIRSAREACATTTTAASSREPSATAATVAATPAAAGPGPGTDVDHDRLPSGDFDRRASRSGFSVSGGSRTGGMDMAGRLASRTYSTINMTATQIKMRQAMHQRKFSTLFGRSLGCLGPHNPLRMGASEVTRSRAFEVAVLLAITASCITLAMESPHLDETSPEARVLWITDLVLTGLFLIEATLKIVVSGFVFNGPMSYLRSTWNQLDFAVLLLSVAGEGERGEAAYHSALHPFP